MRQREEPSSERLMARYQRRGDETAFGLLVERFLEPAHGVARQLLPERAMAEDAVQETFLRLLRRRERYDPRRPFSPWFYAILRNVCTDLLRRRARRAQALQEAGAERERQGDGLPPSLDPFELLDRLSADDRAVLSLRIVHDLAFRDVAAALGISEEAAKKRAQRALRRLRRLARDAQVARRRAAPAQEPVPDQASRA
ncbi:MAG: RNA polymerase sigma factor [Planctomycetota bacterium]